MKIHRFFSKKDIKKNIRSIFQGIILLFILYLIITAIFSFNEYKEYDSNTMDLSHQGFIAISYFGVDRTGSNTLISTKRLEEHLKALRDSGYVSITQNDVVNWYTKGIPLPQKSLLLIFEDGRRDTSIFAQKIMEKYNYKATILTYADKFESRDPKFLMEDELLDLEKSTFWEMGTNGYRLEFINVYDRYKNYIGELSSLAFSTLSPYFDRDYNHYLMDYIRDEYGIPKESYREMKTRIEYDYAKMRQVYMKKIGRLPSMYILMHSNTGQFGTNNKTSSINKECIYDLFSMNFNREGFSFNTSDNSIYDLTRMQPQAYWSTNHLLMRIWDDSGQAVNFITGDIEKANKWDKVEGEAEYKDNSIILTSMPKGRGLLSLRHNNVIKNLFLSVKVEGNKLGSQAIYVRADKQLKDYIYIQIKNNHLFVKESVYGMESELFSLDLDELDEKQHQSLEENKFEAEIAELNTKIIFANNEEDAEKLKMELITKQQKKPSSVEEGGAVYRPVFDLREPGKRHLKVNLVDNKITIYIDEIKAVTKLINSALVEGSIYMESALSENAYSQRNLVDDVYDGIFKDLVVKDLDSENNIIIDCRLHGKDRFIYNIKEIWDKIINWFIKNL